MNGLRAVKKRVSWGTHLNVEEVFGEHGRAVVNRLALTVELATKHLSGDGHLEHVTSELAMSVRVVDVGCALENLIQGKEVKSQTIESNDARI